MIKKNVKINMEHGVIGQSVDLVEVVGIHMVFGKETEQCVQVTMMYLHNMKYLYALKGSVEMIVPLVKMTIG